MPVSDFQPIIGLEVHAQLLTHSKIFSSASTAFGAAPNAQTRPLCLGLPGTLPVLNVRAVDMAIRAGLALECDIRRTSVWARKHYFYPDLPKGYQITQYDKPICEKGRLSFDTEAGEKTVRIHRIHMEEDAGKNIHDASAKESLVDLNRAGTPLIEIVSEADLRTSEEAAEYLKALRDILVYLGVNDGNLEEGSFRCDANVSVMRKGTDTWGTRAELKNINSFRYVRQAIDYEIIRQVELIESGGKVVQETRLWDAAAGETRSMRSKEEAQDYRYFPEPDLPPLVLSDAHIDALRGTLPELPRPRAKRFVAQYGLKPQDARTLTQERAFGEYFESVATHYPDGKKLANWCLGEFLRLQKAHLLRFEQLKFTPEQFASLLKAVDAGTLSNNAAKEVFEVMFETGKAPDAIIQEKGLAQVSDTGAIEAVVDDVLKANAAEVEKLRAGKAQVFGFLVGQCMKALKGKGNPTLVNSLLKQKLGMP